MILCKAKYAKAIDKMIFPGIQGGPLVHVIAAKAVALKEALSQRFGDYQIQVVKNAKELADSLMNRGFKLVSNGTDTHLMLLDFTDKSITGKEAETVLDLAGITVNKNPIPYDDKPATITSGIRVGTPIVTSRKMKEPEMVIIADLIAQVMNNIGDKAVIDRVREKVKILCREFSVYNDIEI
jgi:glycine hydroxymethyltransferase